MTKFPVDTPDHLPMLDILRDHMLDAVYLIDPASSKILWVNKAGYEDLLMEESEVLHHSVLSLQKDVVGLAQWQSIAEVIRQSGQFTFVGRHQRKDGSEFPVEVNTSVLHHNGQEFFISIARDITTRRAQEAESQGREQQIWFALNACADGIWDWQLSSDKVYFSTPLKRMLGYGPDEMQPVVETWKQSVHPHDLPQVWQALEEHIHGQRERYEAVYRLRNRNGHYIWVHDLGSISERDETGKPCRVTGMVKDITDYKQQEFKLLELAAYDELTRLRNRRECSRILDKQLEFARRHDQPLSICLFDFDHFKAINDQYGHLAGDHILSEAAARLSAGLRRSDYLFRWGGEEFVLISVNTDLQAMKAITEKLRGQLEQIEFNYDGHQLQITGSFGLASYPAQGNSRSALLLAADSALYRAKSLGRNCIQVADVEPIF